MRKLWMFFVAFYAPATFAQKTYTVDDFSPDYRATVYVTQPKEVFSPGWIRIEDKKTQKELFKVKSEALAIDAENGKVTSNIRELPYGKQSVIQYEDFNFDGIKDFAIEDGHNSCYGLPSFTVYLGSKTGFKRNQAFTNLAHDYCGMFSIDAKQKAIHTMTKSGCCWHQYSLFKIKDGLPHAVEIHEEGLESYYESKRIEKWDGHKMAITQTRTIDKKEVKTLLNFVLKENTKEVFLFTGKDNNNLNYALINKRGNVELAFPQDSKSTDPFFNLSKSPDKLTLLFENGANYVITEAASGQLTLDVTVDGKTTHYTQGDVKKTGTLKDLLLDIPPNAQLKTASNSELAR